MDLSEQESLQPMPDTEQVKYKEQVNFLTRKLHGANSVKMSALDFEASEPWMSFGSASKRAWCRWM